MQTDFGGGRRKRIVKFSQRRVETGLHICISAYCLNFDLIHFGWSENGPSADPPGGGSRRAAPKNHVSVLNF